MGTRKWSRDGISFYQSQADDDDLRAGSAQSFLPGEHQNFRRLKSTSSPPALNQRMEVDCGWVYGL